MHTHKQTDMQKERGEREWERKGEINRDNHEKQTRVAYPAQPTINTPNNVALRNRLKSNLSSALFTIACLQDNKCIW